MKYIKDFDTWLNENYPSFGNKIDDTKIKELLQKDTSDLVFSFFDGGEQKFKTKLQEFNKKYDTCLLIPLDWSSLVLLDDPEKIYTDVADFAKYYTDFIT